jgi:hypothetical protein
MQMPVTSAVWGPITRGKPGRVPGGRHRACAKWMTGPVMFDFEKPRSRDTIETIRTLAGMSKFIIADLTDAKAVVQEMQAIVPNLPSVAVRFIIRKSERELGMFDHIRRFPWVLDGAFEYDNPEEVINSISDSILEPIEAKLKELFL